MTRSSAAPRRIGLRRVWRAIELRPSEREAHQCLDPIGIELAAGLLLPNNGCQIRIAAEEELRAVIRTRKEPAEPRWLSSTKVEGSTRLELATPA